MEQKQFNKGDYIFHKNDFEDVFYKVLSGSVGIEDDFGEEDGRLAEIGEGQFFGEMGVIDGYPRSADAVALEDGTTVEVFSLNDLHGYFEESPDHILEIMKALGDRLRSLTAEYEEARKIADDLNVDGLDSNELFEKKLKKYSYYAKQAQGKLDKPKKSEEVKREDHTKGFHKNVITYKKGSVIVREGDMVNCMYDIQWGRVGIYKNYGTPEEQQLAILASNEFFGEIGMISKEPRSATAVALDQNTTIETIYPQDFEELFEKDPVKVDMILRHLTDRVRKLSRRYTDLCNEISKKSGNA